MSFIGLKGPEGITCIFFTDPGRRMFITLERKIIDNKSAALNIQFMHLVVTTLKFVDLMFS